MTYTETIEWIEIDPFVNEMGEFVYRNEFPDDYEEVLVKTTRRTVSADTFFLFNETKCGFEVNPIRDVVAWARMPKGEKDEK